MLGLKPPKEEKQEAPFFLCIFFASIKIFNLLADLFCVGFRLFSEVKL